MNIGPQYTLGTLFDNQLYSCIFSFFCSDIVNRHELLANLTNWLCCRFLITYLELDLAQYTIVVQFVLRNKPIETFVT